MKKLIICLFAIATSFISYAQMEDTTYFMHKNVKFAKIEKRSEGVRTGYTIENIDQKYVGDKTNLYKGAKADGNYQNINNYYDSVNVKIRKDVREIWFKYVKDHFTHQEKKNLLRTLKNPQLDGRFLFVMFIELNGSPQKMNFIMYDDTYKDEDIANLDLLVRDNLVLEGSGLSSQRPSMHTTKIDRKLYIEFLEKELSNGK